MCVAMCDAVIFDFDYTLGDATRGIELSVNYALEKLGYPCKNTEEIKKTIGLSLKDTFETLTLCGESGRAGEFSRLFKEKADEVMVPNTQLYAPVKEVLRRIREHGCRTGIVTTKYHYRIDQILSKFGAGALIDLIVGAEDVKVEKPNPEGLLCAARNLSAEKERVIYVGDSTVDAETAERAGIRFIGVLTGTTDREAFARYHSIYIGETMKDVYDFIFA